MPLFFSNGTSFTKGAMPYQFRPATSKEAYKRIILRVFIGEVKTLAIVDTGGVFFVCTPELGKQLGLDPKHGAPTERLYLRGRTVASWVCMVVSNACVLRLIL